MASTCTLLVTVLTDDYPEETTWSLTDTCTSTIIWSNDNEGDLVRNTSYSFEECVPQGKYTFEINDEYGDGICCNYGIGKYTMSYKQESEDNGGYFNDTDSRTMGSCTASPTTSVRDFQRLHFHYFHFVLFSFSIC